ncbi:MAG: DUF3800 domain-containing protein [Chlamydiales bacterium]|nr:DUF3800 domain-containing protein [Chlamydiales bacterium]
MRNDFSDYIIFADESGDHGIASINPENPVFVLAFCIFRKVDYISIVKQAVAKFKIDFWGHDLVVLHNHEIRKSTGEFVFLFDEETRKIFLHALNEMIRSIPFSIAATAIDKRYLSDSPNSTNPYVLALGSCLNQTLDFLQQKQQQRVRTHIIVESRGKTEDRDLGLAFDQIASQVLPEHYPLEIRFANKQTNSSGLQIADLVAHPIARHIVKKSQPNKAFDIVKEKLLGHPEYEGIGLRCHPLESEKPRLTPRLDADRELPIHL